MKINNIKLSNAIRYLAFIYVAFFIVSCTSKNTELKLIRIGWQTSWVPQAQLAMVLNRTNVLEINGLKGEFRGFTYGGPLSEAALADQIDVLFAADQPAINLIARGAKWKIVSKCISFRDALLVPPQSKIQNARDLRGKKIAVPFGSGAHRIVIELIKEAELDVDKDVKLINLDVTEINAAIEAGTIDKNKSVWQGDIAAAANWDPNIARFEYNQHARVLVEKRLFGVTAMSENFIHSDSIAAVGFIKALHEAVFYYAKHQDEANTWYTQEININLDPKIFTRSSSFDLNLKVDSLSQVDISFNDNDIQVLQSSSDFAYSFGLIKTQLQADLFIDKRLIQIAKEAIGNNKIYPHISSRKR